MRPGGYTAGRAQADREEASAVEQRESLKDRCLRLKKQVNRARSDSGRSSRKATKRGLSSRDHDARAKVDIGRVTGRDAAVVRRAVQLEKRLERESKLRDSVAVKKQYTLGVWTEGTAPAACSWSATMNGFWRTLRIVNGGPNLLLMTRVAFCRV